MTSEKKNGQVLYIQVPSEQCLNSSYKRTSRATLEIWLKLSIIIVTLKNSLLWTMKSIELFLKTVHAHSSSFKKLFHKSIHSETIVPPVQKKINSNIFPCETKYTKEDGLALPPLLAPFNLSTSRDKWKWSSVNRARGLWTRQLRHDSSFNTLVRPRRYLDPSRVLA